MGLISKYVEVSVCGKEQKYYESLGYEIPRTEKRMCVLKIINKE